MKTVILTSYLDFSSKDENGNHVAHNFGINYNTGNNILKVLKKYIKKFDNMLFVSSNPSTYDSNDKYFNITVKSFEQTLPFKNYNLLDNRNKQSAKALVENADFIFFSGGHVPTQVKFLNDIKISDYILNTNAVVAGGSAGSMSIAKTVYCPPEEDGEAVDPNFVRWLTGAGVTNINIYPHYQYEKDIVSDGKHRFNDFVIPDSHIKPVVCINDGSFIVEHKGKAKVYGEAYLIKNGVTTQICKNGKSKKLKI